MSSSDSSSNQVGHGRTKVSSSLRTASAVLVARITSEAVRKSGKGGGSSLPGLVASRLQPDVVRILAKRLEAGTAIVTGTNGKTTTARMLAGILAAANYVVVRNASGSNLTRGVASALLSNARIRGSSSGASHRFGLFEVDEAALPKVASMVAPSTLVLNNLFRDQLDRYGEVATVARLWSNAISDLPPASILIANADDPLVTDVALAGAHPTEFFGIRSLVATEKITEHSSDVKSCPRCGGVVSYSLSTLGHLGHYQCSTCDFRRPQPTVWAEDVALDGVNGSRFTLRTQSQTWHIALPLPGLYNVYNAVAAAATALSLGVSGELIAPALGTITAAFGRMERIAIDGKLLYLALAKNPAGLNEVLRTLVQSEQPPHLLMMLNDNTADGRDVSWIWDADVEMLSGLVKHITFAGTRGGDMALRFKYGEVHGTDGESPVIEPDTSRALNSALACVEAGGVLFVVPTYTAMLDVRSVLAGLGHVKPYWEG